MATTTATVHQAYRFALDPTPRQQGKLASHTGAARFAFNWGLALVKERLERRAAGEDVRVPWSLFDLRREWNQAKRDVAPWWPENSKEAYSSGLDGLARALSNWSDAKRDRRKGARMGFPRRKRKGRACDACRFTTGAIRVEPDRHHVTLPRLGRLRTHESTRKLARRLEQGTARILAATISRQGGRWFVSFTCEVQRAIRGPHRPQARIGVDVGIRHLAVLSDGRRVPNPAPLQAAMRQLRRLNRQLFPSLRPHRPRRQQPRAVQRMAADQTRTRQSARQSRQPASQRPAPPHQYPDRHLRHGGSRAPQRRRHAPQPTPGQADRGRGFRGAAPPAHLQGRLGGRDARPGRHVLSVVEDLLGLWARESQAAPVRADLPV